MSFLQNNYGRASAPHRRLKVVTWTEYGPYEPTKLITAYALGLRVASFTIDVDALKLPCRPLGLTQVRSAKSLTDSGIYLMQLPGKVV